MPAEEVSSKKSGKLTSILTEARICSTPRSGTAPGCCAVAKGGGSGGHHPETSQKPECWPGGTMQLPVWMPEDEAWPLMHCGSVPGSTIELHTSLGGAGFWRQAALPS